MATDIEKAPDHLQELVAKADTGARKLGGFTGRLIFFTALAWALFQYWYASPLPFVLAWGVLNDTEARAIHRSGRKVALIGVENGFPIGSDVSNVKKFYDLGGRYMSLAHNGHSQLSDSNTGERDGVWLHNGLSPLGREVIAEMNRLGMMIDISHPSKQANLQAMALSKAPVIASHSGARAMRRRQRGQRVGAYRSESIGRGGWRGTRWARRAMRRPRARRS